MNNEIEDKDSVNYFMTKMTQAEFEERVYRHKNYPGSIVRDASLCEERKEYFRKSRVHINLSKELKESLLIDDKKDL